MAGKKTVTKMDKAIIVMSNTNAELIEPIKMYIRDMFPNLNIRTRMCSTQAAFYEAFCEFLAEEETNSKALHVLIGDYESFTPNMINMFKRFAPFICLVDVRFDADRVKKYASPDEVALVQIQRNKVQPTTLASKKRLDKFLAKSVSKILSKASQNKKTEEKSISLCNQDYDQDYDIGMFDGR